MLQDIFASSPYVEDSVHPPAVGSQPYESVLAGEFKLLELLLSA